MTNRLYPLISGLVLVAVTYLLASALYASNTTGLLILIPNDNNATVSIDQAGHKIDNVGRGAQRLRLSPGNYDVVVSDGKNQAIKTVRIQKKQIYNLNLSPKQNQNPKAAHNLEANDLISKYLPFTDRFSTYRVSYTYKPVGGVNQPTIIITAPNTDGQKAALKWINSLGYQADHFDIKYQAASLY